MKGRWPDGGDLFIPEVIDGDWGEKNVFTFDTKSRASFLLTFCNSVGFRVF